LEAAGYVYARAGHAATGELDKWRPDESEARPPIPKRQRRGISQPRATPWEWHEEESQALKGRANGRNGCRFVPPFQGEFRSARFTQGVALGWLVPRLWRYASNVRRMAEVLEKLEQSR
jgi:hypothetical protein